jgi:hypothetical protein
MAKLRSTDGMRVPPPSASRRPLAAVAIGLAVVLSVSLNGCTGRVEETTKASVEPINSATPIAADVAAARGMIEAADLANPETLNAIEGVRFTPAGEEAARAVLAAPAAGDALWAATWVYASSGTDSAVLAPLLVSGDASIRVMAAAALVAAGDRSGFAILAAALSDAGQLRGSQPLISVAGFSASTLSSYIEAAGVPAAAATEAEVAAIAASWSTWLGANEKSLQFDRTSGTWKLG